MLIPVPLLLAIWGGAPAVANGVSVTLSEEAHLGLDEGFGAHAGKRIAP